MSDLTDFQRMVHEPLERKLRAALALAERLRDEAQRERDAAREEANLHGESLLQCAEERRSLEEALRRIATFNSPSLTGEVQREIARAALAAVPIPVETRKD